MVSLRPRQWSKNLIIYFAFFFAINRLWDSDDLGSVVIPFIRATIAFLIFCAIAGAIYLINDRADLKQDRAHPTKRHRPLASGQLRPSVAIAGVVVLLGGGLPAAFVLAPWFGATAVAYLVLMVAYSVAIKRVAILDVMAISAGFVPAGGGRSRGHRRPHLAVALRDHQPGRPLHRIRQATERAPPGRRPE